MRFRICGSILRENVSDSAAAPHDTSHLSRRAFVASAAPVLAAGSNAVEVPRPTPPNIVLFIADQVRRGAVSAYGENPVQLTPNLDAAAGQGTLFRNMFTNQPLCSPSRACLFTGQYGARNGVWRNTGNGVGIKPEAVTLATECRKAGYSANYIGKWHLADGGPGPVASAQRGGFLNLWQAANALELTSHPFEGDLYDGDGRAIHFRNEYRVDFLTGLAQKFIADVSASSPFLLVVSYLEPHHQNDEHRFVAPPGYAERYRNPSVPEDLRFFPGTWQQHLPSYYGCIRSVDEAFGKIRGALAQRGLDKRTILAFVSDHGCHFMTRNTEYKRSGHDASIRIPLLIEGPGFEGGRDARRFMRMVDLTPTLLDAAGLRVPTSMQGRSAMPLLSGKPVDWSDEVFVQLSEFWVGRALRTPQWTYVAVAPREGGWFRPERSAPRYYSFQLYDNYADPNQLVNLAGRQETTDVEKHLRERLTAAMQTAGDVASELLPCPYPYA